MSYVLFYFSVTWSIDYIFGTSNVSLYWLGSLDSQIMGKGERGGKKDGRGNQSLQKSIRGAAYLIDYWPKLLLLLFNLCFHSNSETRCSKTTTTYVSPSFLLEKEPFPQILPLLISSLLIRERTRVYNIFLNFKFHHSFFFLRLFFGGVCGMKDFQSFPISSPFFSFLVLLCSEMDFLPHRGIWHSRTFFLCEPLLVSLLRY